MPVRRPVPAADGGPADGGRGDRDLPAQPDRRLPPGPLDRDRASAPSPRRCCCCAATTAARELQVPLRPGRDRAARPAGRAGDRRDRQRRAALGPRRLAPVPAGRAREDHADRLPRRLPAREARGAGAGPAEGLRPAARDLGRRDARPRRDERPRERAPLLRDLPGDALRRHRAAALRRRWARGSSSRARPASTNGRPRARAGHDLAASLDRPRRSTARSTGRWRCGRTAPATSSSSRCTRSRTATSAARGSGKGTFDDHRGPPADPVPEHRLHLLRARAGARADRRRARCCSSTCSSSRADSGSRCSRRTASRSCSRSG